MGVTIVVVAVVTAAHPHVTTIDHHQCRHHHHQHDYIPITHPGHTHCRYVDLHGHSRKMNVFMYGCDDKRKPKPMVRIFPKLVSWNVTGRKYFSFQVGHERTLRHSLAYTDAGPPAASSLAPNAVFRSSPPSPPSPPPSLTPPSPSLPGLLL